ncbi:MAG: cation:dicarboxylase symporter family transporter [Synergistaceae bacterium]|nr:cation:dicarboxylase symporter family transporter [Synergistaceae bacterium]
MLKLVTDRRKFTFTSQNDMKAISDTLQFIDSEAEKFRTSPREAAQIRMMCEESLVKLLEYATFTDKSPVTATVSAINFLGNVRFTLRIPGAKFDFLHSIQSADIDTDEVSPETYDAINNVLLQQFADRLRYDHRDGVNYLRIAALSSPYNALFMIVASILLAVVAGILMKTFATPETCSYVKADFLVPVSSTLMNAMKMCTIPLVFFSVVVCIARFGSPYDMKKAVLRCMACFLSASTVAAVSSIGVFFMLKPAMRSVAGTLSGMSEVVAEADTNFLTKMLQDLLPPSIIEPFLDNDVLQLLLLGILFGFAMRMADVKRLREIFEDFDKLLVKALYIVCKFTPLIVFCSIARQVLELGFDAVANIAWLAVCLLVSELAVMAVYCASVRAVSGMGVRRFLSKAWLAMLTSASMMSGKAAIPVNMKACKELGVPQNVFSISVPMSAIFNKQGDYIPCVVSSLFLALMCGIDVSAWDVFLLAAQAMLIVVAASGITAQLVIPGILGVPSAAVELVLGVTKLMDMAGVALDSLGALASGVIVAGRKNLAGSQQS